MVDLRVDKLREPHLIFLGDLTDKLLAKTAFGLAYWCPERCYGQLRLSGCTVDLGLPDRTVAEAASDNAGSLIVGSALDGGYLPEAWLSTLVEALTAGLDLVSGLHKRLNEVPELTTAAAQSNARIVDVRVPPEGLPVGTGRKRRGLRLLTVGTDCAVGKKYTALALTREMGMRGLSTDFRATGQTGIMIAGRGIPMDAVIADFLCGAAEVLSPDAEPSHWDVIEGQGSLFHPGYAAVTHGLLIGSQPDALVLCHEAGRKAIDGFEGFPIPSLAACIERSLIIASLTNPSARFVGVSINSSTVPSQQRLDYLKRAEDETSLPCVDPLIDGVGPIVDEIARRCPLDQGRKSTR